jgi:hypothetical protein
VDSGLYASFGAEDEQFDEFIGAIGGVPAYRMSYGVEIPDPEPWLRSGAGLAWLATLRLASGERVQVTGGRADARIIPTAPDADVDRVVSLLESTDSLPAPSALKATDEPPLAVLPEIDSLLHEFAGLLSSDDDERGRRLALADASRLERLVEVGRPQLSVIDAELDRLQALSELSPQQAELDVRLHALAQAIIEADLEFAGRRPPDR